MKKDFSTIVADGLPAGGYGTHQGRQTTCLSLVSPSTDRCRPQPNCNGLPMACHYMFKKNRSAIYVSKWNWHRRWGSKSTRHSIGASHIAFACSFQLVDIVVDVVCHRFFGILNAYRPILTLLHGHSFQHRTAVARQLVALLHRLV